MDLIAAPASYQPITGGPHSNHESVSEGHHVYARQCGGAPHPICLRGQRGWLQAI